MEETFLSEMAQLEHDYDGQTKLDKIFNPLLRTMDKKWFKLTIACVALLSLPLCITLAVVLSSAIPLTILIIIQIGMFILLFPRTFANCLKLYTLLTFYHIGWGIVTIIFTALGSIVLLSIPYVQPVFGWSYLQYISFGSGDDEEESSNLLNFGFTTIFVGIFFFILIILVLPVAAYFEEVIFRRGTKNWKDAIWRSLIFGLIHMSMGVPFILTAVLLSILGLWFTREYFEGIQRFKIRTRPLQDHILDDVELPSTYCSLRPFGSVGCSGDIIPENNWKMEIYKDNKKIFYFNKKTNEAYWKKPPQLLAKAFGTRDAALLHLGHNLVAIIITFIGLIITTAGVSLSF